MTDRNVNDSGVGDDDIMDQNKENDDGNEYKNMLNAEKKDAYFRSADMEPFTIQEAKKLVAQPLYWHKLMKYP